METLKICTACKNTKPMEMFSKNSQKKDGKHPHCKECDNRRRTLAYRSERHNNRHLTCRNTPYLHSNDSKNPRRKRSNSKLSYMRRFRLKNKYGISEDQYFDILNNQDNKCEICKLPPKEGQALVIDHCHNSGKVRALLCITCNTGLGMVKESLQILESMYLYIQKHKRG